MVLESLLDCMDRADRSIGREAALLHASDRGAADFDAIGIALLNGLAQHHGELVLLIDDLHNAADVRINRLLQLLLDFAPPTFHLALLSRTLPRLDVGRLRDQAKLLEIGFRDLQFSFAETEDLLRAQSADLSGRDARRLYDLTAGWASGLRLAALDQRKSAQPVESLRHVRVADKIDEYFRDEVLSRLEVGEADALALLAAATQFNEGGADENLDYQKVVRVFLRRSDSSR